MFVDGVIEAFVRRGGRVHEKSRVVTQTILDGRQVSAALPPVLFTSRVPRAQHIQCIAAGAASAFSRSKSRRHVA